MARRVYHALLHRLTHLADHRLKGATQPSLIVNDLKMGATRGQIALWAGSDTDGYFPNLTVKQAAKLIP
jgi:hypothetical protein